MKILIRSVEPGLKALHGWGEGAEPDRVPPGSDALVGYLRREPSGRWMIVNHSSGREVDSSETGYREAALRARRYFATRSFCAAGCGRLTLGERCDRCSDA